MYLPHVDDERTSLTNFIADQLDAIRASAHGLTDEQARSTPLRSALSVGGIVKHTAWVMQAALVGGYAMDAADAELDADDFFASFVLGEQESLEAMLATFDRLRERYLAMCHDGDLDQRMPVGPMPWAGLDEPREAALRYVYGHHLEEFARHAGHADIIREQIDGAQAPGLLLAAKGRPGNAYVTPWTPAM